MGFLSRLLIPRGVRRAVHPGRAVRRAVTPKVVKRASRALSPIDNATYAFTRSLNTKRRGRAVAYTHAGCSVRHRTPEAAAKCRNR